MCRFEEQIWLTYNLGRILENPLMKLKMMLKASEKRRRDEGQNGQDNKENE